MPVIDDILKKDNPPVATTQTDQTAQGGESTTAPAVVNGATPAPTGYGAKQVQGGDVRNVMGTQQTPTAKITVPNANPAAQPQQPKSMSFVDLLNAFYTPETAEQKAKRERKEKWDKTAAAIGDGISALANLYYTTKGAPNSYDGKNSMSERTRQLYEKLDKDRRENERWYLNHYMNAAKMDEDAKRYQDQLDYRDKQDAYRKEQDELNRQDKKEQFEYNKEQNALNRQDRLDAAKQNQENFVMKFNADQEQQKERNRQFWAKHNLAVDNYNRQMEKENPTIGFALGSGRRASIKKQDINSQNVSYVYHKLPKEVKDQYAQGQAYNSKGEPVTSRVYNNETGQHETVPVMKARKLNQDEMMTIIGEYIGQYPEVQKAWKEVGGEITVPNKDGSTRPNSVTANNANASTSAGGSTRPWAQQTGQTRPWATGK